MSRERQKANHKLKMYALAHGGQLPDGASFDTPSARRSNEKSTEKPWLNHEGYHDPTAYQAMRSKR